MNVYYSTVKEVSNGELDIYVYPADIVYPDVSTSIVLFSPLKFTLHLIVYCYQSITCILYFASGCRFC